MRNYRAYYRSRDGGADYIFSFELQSNGRWRVYIEQQPSYRGRSTDTHSTHRVSNGRCKSISPRRSPRTLDEAKREAAFWAEKTEQYIHTGRRF